MEKRIALFAGSFDPFTKGHEDIVNRGLRIFDEIIIAVGYNNTKSNRYFPIDSMIAKIQGLYDHTGRISVITYAELTAGLAQKHNARFLLRGLRNTTDFEYENSISQINRKINNELETVFLITSPEFAWISSSIVRDVHRYGGDIAPYIPFKLDT